MTVIISRPDSTPLPSFITMRAPTTIEVPSSKSLSHRALIAASLAGGISEIKNLADNNDTEATINCLRMLGVRIGNTHGTVLVHGIQDFSAYNGSTIDCGESGSTLRFLLPLFAQSGRECTFTGAGRLLQRPLTIYEELYDIQRISHEGKAENDKASEHADENTECEKITVSGTLRPGVFAIPGNISSQFITGLLFILPLLDGDSVIDIYPPFESESYVRLTVDMLTKAGIRAEMTSARDFFRLGNIKNMSPLGRALIKIPGNQKYSPIEYTVEGDWSSAAFLIAQSMLSGKELILSGIDAGSAQGDKAIIKLAENFGADIRKTTSGEGFLAKPAIEVHPGAMKAIKADISDCPDLGPVLFALATQAHGTSVFTGISRLRLKESDRIASMEAQLTKMGCRMRSDRNTVWIDGPCDIKGGQILKGHGDHRIVMALSVLAARAWRPLYIEGAEAVAKSYPEFFEHLAACGMNVQSAEQEIS